MIFRFDQTEKAMNVLAENNIKTIDGKTLYTM
jgi:hypothetical protein